MNNHFEYLIKYFLDPRYIRVNNKPVLQIYLPLDIPNLMSFTDKIRNLAILNGFDGLFLIGCNLSTDIDPTNLGLDASVSNLFHSFRFNYSPKIFSNSILGKIESKFRYLLKKNYVISNRTSPLILKYKNVSKSISQWPKVNFIHYPLIIPDWDNSSRAGNRSLILKDSNPYMWGKQVKRALLYVKNNLDEEKFIFIKSWNEWAEGNYLEPDNKWGYAYLEEFKRQIDDFN